MNRKWLWRTLAVCTAVTGALLGSCVHSHAAVRPAAPAAAARFTVSGHAGHCAWKANGRKSRGYLALRMVKDTCPERRLRIRAAGTGVAHGFVAGNWIDKVHQLTSVAIGPDVFSDYGYDYQYNWGRHARHRGRVRYVSKDHASAAAHADATATPVAKTSVVYALNGYSGYSHQYVRPVRFSMEQGTEQWRNAGWRWRSASAVSRHAQYRYVSGKTAGPWESAVLRFSGIREHKIRNLDGSALMIRFFIRARMTFPGSSAVQHFCFGTGSGTRHPVWYGC